MTDLTRMGEWSTENTGGKWLGGATGPSQGAAFRGNNRNGIRRWSTKVTIDECEAPNRLSFRSVATGLPMAQWTYDITETADGCDITESWTDLRPGFFKPISALASGVSDRSTFAQKQMELTLDGVAQVAEGSAAS